ncbi:hypothetical protein [Acidovorax sp. JHL-3]|uniref:hypothetical protein n=1 Tax=Acidovorax sp. JHL-3 TaxID=1276755 RepID=UPI0012DEF2D2|nr:hypothetical protein [Acidovorax sp. JHL-3]
MSLFVIVVAAGHAIPPVIAAALGKSKTTVFIGAGIACAIAVMSGNPAFIATDIIGVGLGT